MGNGGPVCGKELEDRDFVLPFTTVSPAPRKMPAKRSSSVSIRSGPPWGRSWVGRGPPCLGAPRQGFAAWRPEIILQESLAPPRGAAGCIAVLCLTSHSGGGHIPSRRRCVEIGFAARVKLGRALSWLSPAFETESVLPNEASPSRPLPTGIRARQPQPVPSGPLPWPGPLSLLSLALVMAGVVVLQLLLPPTCHPAAGESEINAHQMAHRPAWSPPSRRHKTPTPTPCCILQLSS